MIRHVREYLIIIIIIMITSDACNIGIIYLYYYALFIINDCIPMKKYIIMYKYYIALQRLVYSLIATSVLLYILFMHKCFNFDDLFVLQVVNHVGRMSRGRRKLLGYGLVVGTLLLLAYKLRTCPEPEPQTMFMMPKDVSIPHLMYHDIEKI